MTSRITDRELLRCGKAHKDTLINFDGRSIDPCKRSVSLTRDAIAELERLMPVITSFKENASLLTDSARAHSISTPSQEALCEHLGLTDKVQRDGELLADLLAKTFSRHDCSDFGSSSLECEVFAVFLRRGEQSVSVEIEVKDCDLIIRGELRVQN